MIERSRWALNHFVVLVIMAGFAFLLIEVRYLHDDVLEHHAIAWTPIVYSGLMAVAILAGLCSWNHGGRRVLFWCFAAALVIGPIGYWEHNEGRPWRRFERELLALVRPVGHANDAPAPAAAVAAESNEKDGGHHAQHEDEGGGPPSLAPLSIAGLGLLGMLACARRFQPMPGVESHPAPRL